ncbi:MAG: ceramide glucosyltransferase [Pseudomonadota bacterium]
MTLPVDLASGFTGIAVAAQLGSIALAQAKQRMIAKPVVPGTPKVTVLRPVCGLENNLAETLATTFDADYPDVEIIFCVARPDDPAIPLLTQLIARHPGKPARVLVGDDAVSGNPKLNNLVKGWRAATADWILMADSNVLLPPDYIQRLFAEWSDGTGLVSSPPAGIRPEGFAARLECAFLNSLQGRWQLASAHLDNAYAQGKVLFWRRDVLDGAGGIAVLGREMAEDVAATKLVRSRGLAVRLTRRLFAQPVGRRSLRAVWDRQVRWAKVRRLGFLPLFLAEILLGSMLPLAAVLAVVLAGAVPWQTVPALLVVWYGAEFLLARGSGWPAGAADVLAWICRDALLVPLWVTAWFGNGFDWRGNAMTAGAPAPGKPRKDGHDLVKS